MMKIKNKSRPIISIIAAIGKNRELGNNGKLLWRIPEDLKRFKSLTMGHTVIMGRKTFQSIGKPLPQRVNIIVTRDQKYHDPDICVTHSLQEALTIAEKKEKEEIFIIGGGTIYNQAITLTDKLYLTLVESTATADTFFPDYKDQFKLVKTFPARSSEDMVFTFKEFLKK